MYGFVISLHVLTCLLLVVVVLLQSGKGGGLAGAFGGGGQSVFGGRGASNLLTRATMILGGLFFVTSLTLALMNPGTTPANRSLLQEEARRAAPAGGAPTGTPATLPAAPLGGTPTPAPVTPTPTPTQTAPAPASPAPSGGR